MKRKSWRSSNSAGCPGVRTLRSSQVGWGGHFCHSRPLARSYPLQTNSPRTRFLAGKEGRRVHFLLNILLRKRRRRDICYLPASQRTPGAVFDFSVYFRRKECLLLSLQLFEEKAGFSVKCPHRQLQDPSNFYGERKESICVANDHPGPRRRRLGRLLLAEPVLHSSE